ncbi:MAG: PilZ domain-containing protein [Myxococcota bacterium]|nr:PilZ domain-containing protein [Myxococcota bacterium]
MANAPQDKYGIPPGQRRSEADPPTRGLCFETSEDAIEGCDADDSPVDQASEYADLSRRRHHGNSPLSEPETEQWRWLRSQLEKALSKGSRETTPDQNFVERRFLRVPTRREIEFSDGARHVSGLLTQVGEGGVFIATALPFKRDTRVRLKLGRKTEGGNKDQIGFGGVVRWARFRQHGGQPAGMGLSFDELDERQYENIVELMKEALFLTLSKGDS